MSLPIVLDVAIGLIGFFFALSLLASALLEFYAALLNRPGKILQWGIGHLFADQGHVGLARDFYNHPLIHGMSGARLPSNIAPATAARVLVDLMDKSGVLNGAPANPVLATFVDEALGKQGSMRENLLQPIADWYKEGVERLSGVAARRSQTLLLCIGLVMAASMNIDAIAVVRALATQDDLRRVAVEAAIAYYEKNPQDLTETPQQVAPETNASEANASEANASDAAASDNVATKDADAKTSRADLLKQEFEKTYAAFPIFWKEGSAFCAALKSSWLGWLVTAVAISMGAQFWYRLLGEFLKLRGGKPAPATDIKTPADKT